MNAVAETAPSAELDIDKISAALATWYSDHSPIRRLWATENSGALKVLVALEPTSDGDDPLPIWLANYLDWANDLQLCLKRGVQLQLALSDAFGGSYVDSNAVRIAEVSWRDSWITA